VGQFKLTHYRWLKLKFRNTPDTLNRRAIEGERRMAQPQLQPEKRNLKRFSLNLPVVVRRLEGGSGELKGVTRDVSSRGVFVYLESNAGEGAAIEFLMSLPTEVTLAEPIHVLCTGKVVRVEQTAPRPGFAVAIEDYDFVEMR
jgi:PilZ domain